MQFVGLSPALGAFVAGVVLADSEYRHEIETDIEPFRGLLLGLFFISVGAGIDFGLLAAQPFTILGLVALLIAVKAVVMLGVAKLFRQRSGDGALIGLGLAQGGEFAFVLFAFAQNVGVIPGTVTAPLIVVVALSMALTPLLLMAGQALMIRADTKIGTVRAPEIEAGTYDVIIAGYGRFGQIVGRVLSANGYKVSVLEHDADQVELLRGFGRKVNYGDATRLDLLRIAGAGEAQLLVVAIDDADKSLELVETARKAFPNLKIVARAFDRRHAYELMTRRVDGFERETFAAGVRLAVKSMRLLGKGAYKADRAGKLFTRYDERVLEEMFSHWADKDDAGYQRLVRDRTALEEQLIARDSASLAGRSDDDQWGEISQYREAFERDQAQMSPRD
jgi:glutathione-regulated potassium-efflux system ancillary protein KefC/glutathione-regulated potassium-efflux system protein KefB